MQLHCIVKIFSFNFEFYITIVKRIFSFIENITYILYISFISIAKKKVRKNIFFLGNVCYFDLLT